MTATRGTVQTIAIAGGIGVASGLLSYLVPEALDRIGPGTGSAIFQWLLRLWPGIIYGALIGIYLKRTGVATTWQAALFVPLDTAAWYTALWFAIAGPKALGLPLTELWQLGIISGLIGASLVALSALILFPFFRHLQLVGATIVAGGAMGVLLAFGAKGLALIVLFAVWQGAVAACFGWGVARAREKL